MAFKIKKWCLVVENYKEYLIRDGIDLEPTRISTKHCLYHSWSVSEQNAAKRPILNELSTSKYIHLQLLHSCTAVEM